MAGCGGSADDLNLRGWYVRPSGDPRTWAWGKSPERTARALCGMRGAVAACCLDLRGHGVSRDGDLTTLGYLERADVVAAYNFLLQQPEINQPRGPARSNGSAAAVIRAAVGLRRCAA